MFIVLLQSHPDLNIQGLTLHDVATRAQMGKRPPILRPVLTSPTSQVSTTITPQFQEVNKVSKKGITGVRIKFEPQTNSKLPHVRLSSPQVMNSFLYYLYIHTHAFIFVAFNITIYLN